MTEIAQSLTLERFIERHNDPHDLYNLDLYEAHFNSKTGYDLCTQRRRICSIYAHSDVAFAREPGPD